MERPGDFSKGPLLFRDPIGSNPNWTCPASNMLEMMISWGFSDFVDISDMKQHESTIR